MNIFKKAVYWVCFFFFLFSLFGCKEKTEDAKNSKEVYIYGDNITTTIGNKITIPVKLEKNDGFAGAELKITYDNTILSFEGVYTGYLCPESPDKRRSASGGACPVQVPAAPAHRYVDPPCAPDGLRRCLPYRHPWPR